MIRKSSRLFRAAFYPQQGYLSAVAPIVEAQQVLPVSAAGFAAKAATKAKAAPKKTTAKKATAKKPAGEKIFVTGCSGQIGKALLPALCNKYGAGNVMATDVVKPSFEMENSFEKLDVTQKKKFNSVVEAFKPTKIIHLAAILSATAEANPQLALDVNLGGFQNAINAAHQLGAQLYCPSTLAVYGPDAPKTKTPLHVALRPTSIYGVTKVENELLGAYYKQKYGVDYRSLRYVGIMSSEELPMHGTTDYSTDMILKAIQGKTAYQVYLSKNRKLPMMYIDEAIDATLMYIEAPQNKLSSTVYNLNGACVAPQDFAKEIQKKYPKFKVTYKPDFRDQVAQSWPTSINDSLCTKDWGWSTKITAAKLVQQVIQGYNAKLAITPGEPVAKVRSDQIKTTKKTAAAAKKAPAKKTVTKAASAKKTTSTKAGTTRGRPATTTTTTKRKTASATPTKRAAAKATTTTAKTTGMRGRPATPATKGKTTTTGGKRGRPASVGAKTTGKKA